MAYFAKFTERGQRALLAAQAEAAKLGRSYVGTEHLLLGVLTEPGAASMVLRGVTLDACARRSSRSSARARRSFRASRWSIRRAPRRCWSRACARRGS